MISKATINEEMTVCELQNILSFMPQNYRIKIEGMKGCTIETDKVSCTATIKTARKKQPKTDQKRKIGFTID